ncbi:MAG: winged helix-turn-helix domain-containing protein, partial [Vicinamibacteria bacterium]
TGDTHPLSKSEARMTLDSHFWLGDWIVKPHTNSVVGPDGEAHVEPKAMQVLSFLAQRPGPVVTKQEILTDVWSDADRDLPEITEARRYLASTS